MTATQSVGALTIGGGAPASTPRVIGLDLSITATGLALWDGATETISGTKYRGDQRLVHIRKIVLGYVLTPRTTLAVIEDLPTHAHGAGITGMVHGVVREALLSRGIPYTLVPPASLKKYAVGKGNATKGDMRMALYQRTGLDLRDDNQVDAAWLRMMGLDALGQPVVELPKTQRAALIKMTWPGAVDV